MIFSEFKQESQRLEYATGFIESQVTMQATTQATMQATMQATTQATTQATPQATPQAEQVLLFCDTPKSRSEVQAYLGLKDREHFRKSILNPLIASGKLLLTIPEKPTSPKQRFYAAVAKNKNAHGGEDNEKQ